MNETHSSPGHLAIFAIALSCALAVTIGVVWFYHRSFAPRIVTIDLQGYLNRQRTLVAEGKLTQDEWRNQLDALDRQLASLPANHIVLQKGVVLRNGEELALP